MGSGVKTARLRIGGMTCVNCQNKIEKKLRCTAGILSAGVSCGSGNAYITYDADIISLRDIRTVIEKQGYKVIADAGRGPRGAGRVIGLLIIIAALYMLLRQFGILNLLVPGRLAQTNMGYGMLFVVGLLTSVHCIAMCGGINLSQCISQDGKCGAEGRKAALWPTFLYNLARYLLYGGRFYRRRPGFCRHLFKRHAGHPQANRGHFYGHNGRQYAGYIPVDSQAAPGMPKTLARKIDVEKGRAKAVDRRSAQRHYAVRPAFRQCRYMRFPPAALSRGRCPCSYSAWGPCRLCSGSAL